MTSSKPTRRFFTDESRAAAAEARRRKREMRAAGLNDSRDVFVVRHLEPHDHFNWEIRQFGGVLVRRSDAAYPCMQKARFAGEWALSTLREQTR